MSFRFRKSKKLFPGIRFTISKSGPSVRVGNRRAGLSVGPGGKRISANVPGTGITYSKKIGESSKSGKIGAFFKWIFIACILLTLVLAALKYFG